MNVTDDTVVTVHYRVTDPNGTLLDTSEGSEPLTYLHGHGRIVRGLEQAIAGREPGTSIKTTVCPSDGYGDRDPDLEVSFPITVFSDDAREHLKPGARFRAKHPRDGTKALVFTILSVDEAAVLADGNHPLAGQTLCFEVDIIAVREAREDDYRPCQGCHARCAGGTCSEG